DPDSDFESAVHTWLDAVIDGPVAVELAAVVARLDAHSHRDALGQKLIQLTAPGVPDVYQGTELWDDSLVDPDNRRPVDFARRAALLREAVDGRGRVPAFAGDLGARGRGRACGGPLVSRAADGRIKLFVTHAALEVRARRAEAFGAGGAY